MTKAIGYIRVSTDKQADQGHSLEAQRVKLEQYCSLYDIELVRVVVESGSGKSLAREGLEDALKGLEAGEGDALVVTKLDRLTRSVADLGRLVEDTFQKFALLSVGEQIDTRSAAGRLVLNVLASVSQWEREVISERTSNTMQHMKSEGKYTGGIPPYGFDLVDGDLVPNEGEQEVLEVVSKYRKRGYTLKSIAEELAKAGIKSRAGKPFAYQGIQRMLAA
jgi:DNA invertase Pin-like site-specific DNA recombinase